MKLLPTLLAAVLTLNLLQPMHAEVVSLPGELSLPDGWTHKKLQGVDSNPGALTRTRDGLVIQYDIGMLAGIWVRPEDKAAYAWYLEQTIHGHPVRMALIKNETDEQILRVSFVDATANFTAPVKSAADVAEILAILLSFDYAIPPGKEGKMKAGVVDPPATK